jgi:hypothetical protein
LRQRGKEGSLLTGLSKNTCFRAHGTNQSFNALLKAPSPTVFGTESSVEALIDVFARNLESDKVLTLDNGLPAFGAVDSGFPFHGSSPALCFVFLVGQLLLNRFQVLISLLQASADLVDGFENGNVVDADVHFALMLPEELLDEDDFCPKSLVCRVINRWIYLVYKVIPRGVACDWDQMLAFLAVQKIEIGRDEGDKQ